MTRLRFPPLGLYAAWSALGVMAGLWGLAASIVVFSFSPPDGWYATWVDLPGGVSTGMAVWEFLAVALPISGVGGFLAGRLSRPVGPQYLIPGCLTITVAALIVLVSLPALGVSTPLHRARLLWWEYLPEAILFLSVWLGRIRFRNSSDASAG